MSPAVRHPRSAPVSQRRGRSPFLILLLTLVAACTETSSNSEPEVELLVSVAASMTDAIAAIVSEFEASHPDAEVAINVGSSGDLARQIARGAKVDLYITADPAWNDWLIDQGARAQRRSAFAGNELVLVVPPTRAEVIRSVADLTANEVNRIAIGHPDTSPAGRYAMRELERRGVADALADKLIRTDHVRQALVYLERGEADAAFVYKTDVRTPESLHIVERFPLPDRIYEALTLEVDDTSNERTRLGDELLDFFQSPAAARLLREHGFVVD